MTKKRMKDEKDENSMEEEKVVTSTRPLTRREHQEASFRKRVAQKGSSEVGDEVDGGSFEVGNEVEEESLPPLDPFVESSIRQPESILKPLLMLAVILLVGSMIGDYREEVEYFFESDVPVELGVVDTYPAKRAEDPKFKPPLVHNTYVHLQGIPLQRSQSNKHLFFQLAGDDIFVESKKEGSVDELEELQRARPAMEIIQEIDRMTFEGSGRALSFAHLPGRYNGIRRYYASRYGETFCESLTEEGKATRLQQRKDAILSDWREEYAGLTAAQRASSHMAPEPTKDELEKIAAAQPLCVDAFLIQDGKSPRDHLIYVIGLFVACMIILYNSVLLIRWILRAVRH